MKEEPRNVTIDFYRGLAALMIVVHHTACYSGVVYSPYSIIPATMFLDVPAFMFLAGWSFSYIKGFRSYVKNLLRLFFSYAVFSFIYIMVVEICNYSMFDIKPNFIRFIKAAVLQSLFKETNHEAISVVNASLWFIPMYIKVFGAVGLALLLLYKLIRQERSIRIMEGIVLCVLFLTLVLSEWRLIAVPVPMELIFYSFFFLLGFTVMRIKRFPLWILITLEAAAGFVLICMELFSNRKLIAMANNKFPPNLMFFFFSMLFIIVIMMGNHLPIKAGNPFVRIGKMSIFIFFAQGFAVSLLKETDHLIPIQSWPVKYGISCVITIAVTVWIAILLKWITQGLWKRVSSCFQKRHMIE